MALQAINPTTGEALATYEELSAETVQGIIAVLTSLGVEAKGVAFGTARRLRAAA